eukprot:TRINITY_DN44662_c0_g1_i4.p1 TRINITY_DN44662_c0_g1~~TRINITY_DN44662_c0_g1_i4.p1  ORF type:complete len:230 (-),score=22.88 TRINITY_DN44662_c0_g1_i4:240-929(-)
MATATFARRVGAAISKGSSSWYDPHMEAASRAILERIPLVDLTVEIRDARIPLSSAYNQPSHLESSSKRMIVLNKMDLADRSQTQKWMRYFQQQNCICYGVNSHNKDNIKEFLKFIQAQIRELKVGQSNYTATVLLIGIPNVGKSAIANSLHQIGRISAAGIDHKFSTYQNKLTILWIRLWAIFWTTSLFFLLSHGCHYILCMLISREGKVETCNCKSITRGDKGYQQF